MLETVLYTRIKQRGKDQGEATMSKQFAEKIIASMVDESGYCGERGISPKQFTFLSECLEPGEWQDAGCWCGQWKTLYFQERFWHGIIGEWEVTLREHVHFNDGYQIEEIAPADPEALKAIKDAEAEEQRIRDLLKFPNSEYQYQPKKRLDLELTLLRDYEYDGYSYFYYDNATSHIYTFTDEDGNCFVLKTKKLLMADVQNEDGTWDDTIAEVGSKVTMRATVKEHSEYRGIKQTVLTRPQFKKIA